MRPVRPAIALMFAVTVTACQTMTPARHFVAPVPTAGNAPALPSSDSHSRTTDGAATMRGRGVVGINSARGVDAATRASSFNSVALAESSQRRTIVIVALAVAALVVAALLLSGDDGIGGY